MDKYAQWRFVGLSKPMYYALLEAVHFNEHLQYRKTAALHGIKIDAPSDTSQEEAEEKIAAGPLRDFPYDVDYEALLKDILKIPDELVPPESEVPSKDLSLTWTRERIDALRGNDPVAKRASVKGDLWVIYREVSKRREVTLDLLRQFLENDLELYAILPYGAHSSAYGTIEHITVVPQKHLEKLHKEGKLPKSVAKIYEVVRSDT